MYIMYIQYVLVREIKTKTDSVNKKVKLTNTNKINTRVLKNELQVVFRI